MLLRAVIIFAVPFVIIIADAYVIETRYGGVRGNRNRAPNGKNVLEFLGVPFAKPPLGELRFRSPRQVEKWTGTMDTTRYQNTCVQKSLSIMKHVKSYKPYISKTTTSEDCLYLNIWIPNSGNRSEELPVMLFFYGGAFFFGTASADGYDGGVLATEENVIVVTTNYRVGVFGFLSLDDQEVPGNAGLLDQQMAMRWIHQNIMDFGGDPNRVTIFGQSAGSASVNYHLIAPSSWDYFQGAILMSGFVNDYWAMAPKKRNDELGWQLVGFMECKKATVNETLKCLQEFDAQEIIDNEPVHGYNFGVYLPVIDGYFLKDDPLVLYERGKVKACNIVTGVTKNDGIMFVSVVVPEEVSYFSRNTPKPSYNSILKVIKAEKTVNQHPLLTKATEYMYTGCEDRNDTDFNLRILDNIITDSFFTCKMIALHEAYLKLSTKGQIKIYSYVLEYRLSFLTQSWLKVSHGSELPLVFGHGLKTDKNKYQNVEEKDVILTRRVLRYLANFARTGNPSVSPTGKLEAIDWPEHTTKGEEYLVLAPNSTMIGAKLRHKQCIFQNKFLPVFAKTAAYGT